jgi:hypothetical protein
MKIGTDDHPVVMGRRRAKVVKVENKAGVANSAPGAMEIVARVPKVRALAARCRRRRCSRHLMRTAMARLTNPKFARPPNHCASWTRTMTES